jgi:hypothetical protein
VNPLRGNMMPAPIRVRRLGAADAPAYRALMLSAYLHHPEAFTSSHAERVDLPLAGLRVVALTVSQGNEVALRLCMSGLVLSASVSSPWRCLWAMAGSPSCTWRLTWPRRGTRGPDLRQWHPAAGAGQRGERRGRTGRAA